MFIHRHCVAAQLLIRPINRFRLLLYNVLAFFFFFISQPELPIRFMSPRTKLYCTNKLRGNNVQYSCHTVYARGVQHIFGWADDIMRRAYLPNVITQNHFVWKNRNVR